MGVGPIKCRSWGPTRFLGLFHGWEGPSNYFVGVGGGSSRAVVEGWEGSIKCRGTGIWEDLSSYLLGVGVGPSSAVKGIWECA